MGTGLIWHRIGTGADHCGRSDETSISIKYGELLDYLRNCKILKKEQLSNYQLSRKILQREITGIEARMSRSLYRA
jgi:ribosomal protein S18